MLGILQITIVTVRILFSCMHLHTYIYIYIHKIIQHSAMALFLYTYLLTYYIYTYIKSYNTLQWLFFCICIECKSKQLKCVIENYIIYVAQRAKYMQLHYCPCCSTCVSLTTVSAYGPFTVTCDSTPHVTHRPVS